MNLFQEITLKSVAADVKKHLEEQGGESAEQVQQTWQRIATHFERKDLKRKKENEEEKESLKQRKIEEEDPKERSEDNSMSEQHPEKSDQSMDVDGVRLGKFATVLDLNSLNFKE